MSWLLVGCLLPTGLTACASGDASGGEATPSVTPVMPEPTSPAAAALAFAHGRTALLTPRDPTCRSLGYGSGKAFFSMVLRRDQIVRASVTNRGDHWAVKITQTDRDQRDGYSSASGSFDVVEVDGVYRVCG